MKHLALLLALFLCACAEQPAPLEGAVIATPTAAHTDAPPSELHKFSQWRRGDM